jgi:hypothetical protein
MKMNVEKFPVSYVLWDLLTLHPKCDILYSLHESHNFHKECAFLLMVKMHTPFSAFSYESSEDLCSNNWRCVVRALQLGRTFCFEVDKNEKISVINYLHFLCFNKLI